MEEPLDEFEIAPTTPKYKILLGKTMLINFSTMLAYSIVIGFTMHEKPEILLIINGILLVIQVGLNLLAGFILLFGKHRKISSAFFMGGFVTAAIGFGLCFVAKKILL